MALLQETAYQYYESSQVFVASASQQNFTMTLDPIPASADKFLVYVNDVEQTSGFTYTASTGVLALISVTFCSAFAFLVATTPLTTSPATPSKGFINKFSIS